MEEKVAEENTPDCPLIATVSSVIFLEHTHQKWQKEGSDKVTASDRLTAVGLGPFSVSRDTEENIRGCAQDRQDLHGSEVKELILEHSTCIFSLIGSQGRLFMQPLAHISTGPCRSSQWAAARLG